MNMFSSFNACICGYIACLGITAVTVLSTPASITQLWLIAIPAIPAIAAIAFLRRSVTIAGCC